METTKKQKVLQKLKHGYERPQVGDYICLDSNGKNPSRYAASWYCSQITEIKCDGLYRVSYNDKWYAISEFTNWWFSDKGHKIFDAK